MEGILDRGRCEQMENHIEGTARARCIWVKGEWRGKGWNEAIKAARPKVKTTWSAVLGSFDFHLATHKQVHEAIIITPNTQG